MPGLRKINSVKSQPGEQLTSDPLIVSAGNGFAGTLSDMGAYGKAVNMDPSTKRQALWNSSGDLAVSKQPLRKPGNQ